jgi:hypothetical protein
MLVDRHRSRRLVALASLALVTVAATACGDIRDQSLCTAYEEYLSTAAAVRAIDIEETSAAEASALAEDYLERVQRLQEISDDQDSIALISLESAARDIVLTLESVREDEDASTWAPLVDDSLEDAADAAAVVREEFETECPGTGEEG